MTACDSRVCTVKWMDNSTVCIASNSLSHEPTHVVRRYMKPKSKPLSCSATRHSPVAYNTGVGGVDVMDRLLSLNRPTLREKKWWWPVLRPVRTSRSNGPSRRPVETGRIFDSHLNGPSTRLSKTASVRAGR